MEKQQLELLIKENSELKEELDLLRSSIFVKEKQINELKDGEYSPWVRKMEKGRIYKRNPKIILCEWEYEMLYHYQKLINRIFQIKNLNDILNCDEIMTLNMGRRVVGEIWWTWEKNRLNKIK